MGADFPYQELFSWGFVRPLAVEAECSDRGFFLFYVIVANIFPAVARLEG